MLSTLIDTPFIEKSRLNSYNKVCNFDGADYTGNIRQIYRLRFIA